MAVKDGGQCCVGYVGTLHVLRKGVFWIAWVDCENKLVCSYSVLLESDFRQVKCLSKLTTRLAGLLACIMHPNRVMEGSDCENTHGKETDKDVPQLDALLLDSQQEDEASALLDDGPVLTISEVRNGF